MTKQEAAIISAYTGVLIGKFSDTHEYIERILKRPVFTHELGNKKIWEQIKSNSYNDFVSIKIEG
jgi:hypothetical protein